MKWTWKQKYSKWKVIKTYDELLLMTVGQRKNGR